MLETVHTVKQMLRKSIIRHVLSNQQLLISITAIPNKIGKPQLPHLPYSPRLLLIWWQWVANRAREGLGLLG